MADNPLAAWLLQQDQEADKDSRNGESSQDAPGETTGTRTAPAGDGCEDETMLWDLNPQRRPGSSRRVLLLAGIAWLAVVVLAVTRWWPGSSEPSPSAEDLTTSHTGPVQATADSDDSTLLRVGALLVQAALQGTFTPAAEEHADAARVRYADDAVGTGILRLKDVAVVTVTALVLEGDAEGWDHSRTARYAVALRSDEDGVHPLGEPWPLPGPDTPAPPAPLPTPTDPVVRERVVLALEAAGYREVDELDLARPPDLDGVVVAEVRAVAPGEQTSSIQQVWVRDGPDGAVLGHR